MCMPAAQTPKPTLRITVGKSSIVKKVTVDMQPSSAILAKIAKTFRVIDKAAFRLGIAPVRIANVPPTKKYTSRGCLDPKLQ